MSRRLTVLSFMILTIVSHPISAQDAWLGGNGNWSDATKWSLGVPTANIGASVTTCDTVTLNATAVAKTLYFDCSAFSRTFNLVDNGIQESLSIGKYFNAIDSNILLSGGTEVTIGQNARLVRTSLQLSNGSIFYVGGTLITWASGIETSGSGTKFFASSLNNTGYVVLDAGSSAVVGQLTNDGYIMIGKGATFDVNTSNLTDVPVRAGYDIEGSFTSGSNSAFQNLSSIEGVVNLANGQETTITPGGGLLYDGRSFTVDNASIVDINGGVVSSGVYPYPNSGIFSLSHGSTVNINGDYVNFGHLYIGAGDSTTNILNISGTIKNFGLAMSIGPNSVVNAGGYAGGNLYISPGGLLNLTNQPNGVTDIGGSVYLGGEFRAGNNNALYQLTYLGGSIALPHGQTLTSTPIGGTLNDSGLMQVNGGAAFNANGNFEISPQGALRIGDVQQATTNVSGMLINNGGDVEVSGFGSSLRTGGIQNGGVLNLGSSTILSSSQGFTQFAPATLGEFVSDTGLSIVLVLGGNVSLDGTLRINTPKHFSPAFGSSYDFLLFTPETLTGMFSSIQSRPVDDGLGRWSVTYNNAAGFVQLTVIPAPEPGSVVLFGFGLLALRVSVRIETRSRTKQRT